MMIVKKQLSNVGGPKSFIAPIRYVDDYFTNFHNLKNAIEKIKKDKLVFLHQIRIKDGIKIAQFFGREEFSAGTEQKALWLAVVDWCQHRKRD